MGAPKAHNCTSQAIARVNCVLARREEPCSPRVYIEERKEGTERTERSVSEDTKGTKHTTTQEFRYNTLAAVVASHHERGIHDISKLMRPTCQYCGTEADVPESAWEGEQLCTTCELYLHSRNHLPGNGQLVHYNEIGLEDAVSGSMDSHFTAHAQDYPVQMSSKELDLMEYEDFHAFLSLGKMNTPSGSQQTEGSGNAGKHAKLVHARRKSPSVGNESGESYGTDLDFEEVELERSRERSPQLKLDHSVVLKAWCGRDFMIRADIAEETAGNVTETPSAESEGKGSAVATQEQPLVKKEAPTLVEPDFPHEDAEKNRLLCVERYKEKRKKRLYSKTIRYTMRKINAEKRPRVKGRFVKKNEPYVGHGL